jgi:hypothetical protein
VVEGMPVFGGDFEGAGAGAQRVDDRDDVAGVGDGEGSVL